MSMDRILQQYNLSIVLILPLATLSLLLEESAKFRAGFDKYNKLKYFLSPLEGAEVVAVVGSGDAVVLDSLVTLGSSIA